MSDSFPTPPPGGYDCTGDDPAKILEELEQLKRENNYLRSRVRYLESGRSKCKTSKWSKVKGAFGWEKEKESSLTLKVPDRAPSDQSSSFSVSPAGSCLSHSSLTTPPLLLSSSSSEEDLLHDERRCLKSESERRKNNEQSRRSKSLDGDPTLLLDEHGSKVPSNKAIVKGNKTPWSKVKGIINTKAVRKRSAQEERWGASASMNEGEVEDHSLDEDACGSNALNTPKLTVTLPSNEELSSEPPKKRLQRSSSKLEHSGEKSKWFKVRNVFLQGSRSAPSSPIRSASFTYDLEDDLSSGDVLDDKDYDIFQDEERLKYEVEASYVELQNKLEEELSKKYCREVNLSPEFKKKLEEWDKMKGGSCAPREWENDKEKKRKDRTERGFKEWDKAEDTRKPHSREGSFRKQQNPQSARQEVLIPTSTGTFRFEGISDNFTKKLYEWEKARGIAPEASTFALLGPEYQPTCCRSLGNNGGLTRSKSIGSIADLGQGGQTLAQQPSSLSLNDMDEISHCASLSTGANRTSPGGMDMTSPELFSSDFASHLAKMTSSTSSNEEKCVTKDHFQNQMDNSNYQLLHDNIILLDKLKKERDVCRQLEDDMKTLEGQINSVSKSFLVDRAANAHYERDHGFDDYQLGPSYGDDHLDLMSDNIPCGHVSPMREYTIKLQDFTEVQTTLYDDEATQTNEFDDNVPYLFHDGFTNGIHSDLTLRQSTAAQKTVSELQDLAERLELVAMDKENDSSLVKNGFVHEEEFPYSCWTSSPNYSSYTLPTHWLRSRSSMCNLTKMLNEKLSELKQILSFAQDTGYSSPPPPMTGSLHRTTAHEDLSPGEINPEEFRPLSRASSGASSFSYHVPHGSNSKLHHDWQPYSFQHHLNYIYDSPDPPMERQNAFSGSYTDVTSDGDLSDSGLRVNTPNVFVLTTRKIFSPVSDSEAVGVIIAEEDESTEVENRGERENDQDEQYDDQEYLDAEEPEADDQADEDDEDRSRTPQGDIQHDRDLDNEQPQTMWFSPQIKLRAKSSSPAIERKTPKFSSVCLFFPTTENGVMNFELYPPQVATLPLGEELTSSLKMRALKLKRAKEDFLKNQEREDSMSIVVNEDILNQTTSNGLMVRSVSENFDQEIENIDEHLEQRDTSILGILKLKRKKSKDKGAVAELARHSVCLVPQDASGSQSCPETPIFDKKSDSGAASWIKNPAKMIFRPKGKYTITNQ